MVIKNGVHIFGEIYKLREVLWGFSLIVCFGCWLAWRTANSDHIDSVVCQPHYAWMQQISYKRRMLSYQFLCLCQWVSSRRAKSCAGWGVEKRGGGQASQWAFAISQTIVILVFHCSPWPLTLNSALAPKKSKKKKEIEDELMATQPQ